MEHAPAGCGLCLLAILCYTISVRLIGPTNASIINTFEPACACVFGYLLIGDRITLSMIVGGIMIMISILLTSLPDKSAVSEPGSIPVPIRLLIPIGDPIEGKTVDKLP